MDPNPPGNPLLRAGGVVFLALLAAALLTFVVLQIGAWRSEHMGSATNASSASDKEKLRILASLTPTSTPTVEEKVRILQALRQQQ